MAKDVRITFREGVTARFLKLRRLFVLNGQDEDGAEATVRVPISAVEAILDAAVEAKVEEAAMGTSTVAATGMIVPQRISFMVTPAAGVSLT
ncbi:hypothetical protein ACFZ8E_05730 [Methylobacterium sp. HMF5984]|uniref:hypothetical protein n=1 Tax=Methylobacterium sp. HMF5984 TaxID=3367370 RepID=UPI0038541F89